MAKQKKYKSWNKVMIDYKAGLVDPNKLPKKLREKLINKSVNFKKRK